ncbi:MAG TPA: cupin domain-containing protein [Burkholderiales bacterium]|nr:cupin domain-containing protein [Burkholderiales bacterium]
MNVVTHLLKPDGPIPNHPRWPLLIYPGAVAYPMPEEFERIFAQHRWPPAWRNGVHPFHHYHSNGHEVLGIYRGEVTVQFGGYAGVTVTAKPGDVIVLPAGTGHKKLSSKGALGVVGAYPQGSHPDTCTAFSKGVLETIAHVPLPPADPVYGPVGPLFDHWK